MPVSAETSVKVPSPLLRYSVFGRVRVVVRMAIRAQFRLRAAKRVLVHFPLAVIGDEQVEQAVVVVVHPGGRNGPHLLAVEHASAHSRLVRDVGERAVPVVVEELVLPCVDARRYRASHRCRNRRWPLPCRSLRPPPRFFGYIGKGSIVIVVVQPIPILGAFFLQRRDGRAVYQVDVQIAVVVVVEQRHARPPWFRVDSCSGWGNCRRRKSGRSVPRSPRKRWGPWRTRPEARRLRLQ